MMNDAPGQGAAGAAPDWDAVARYLAGESSAEEAARVRVWLEDHPTDRALVEEVDRTSGEMPVAPVDVEAALAKVHARMRSDAARAPGSRWRGTRVAALSTLALAAALVGVVVVSRSRGTPSAAPTMTKVYATTVGQRDSIQLSDGSRVILGPDSRLSVPADYGVGGRTVELTGDGYFDVHHDSAKPFSVRAGHAFVQDVGTVFSIESDAGDTTNVSVLAGTVLLRSAADTVSQGVRLDAGHRGSIAANGRPELDPVPATRDDAAWTAGRLVFRDASLVRVAGELRRWYGIRLQVVDSSLLDRRLTASFEGETADQVLRTIGLTLGVYVERQGDSAIVSTHSTTTR